MAATRAETDEESPFLLRSFFREDLFLFLANASSPFAIDTQRAEDLSGAAAAAATCKSRRKQGMFRFCVKRLFSIQRGKTTLVIRDKFI